MKKLQKILLILINILSDREKRKFMNDLLTKLQMGFVHHLIWVIITHMKY